MTEPIAVDVPGKPAFARSLTTTPLPTPAPKAEAPKSDAAKIVSAAATVAAVAVGAPPVTPAPLAPVASAGSKLLSKLIDRVGKKRLVMTATAVCSVTAGIAAVRFLIPDKDATTPTAALNTPAPAVKAPSLLVEPPVQPGPNDRLPPTALPPIPVGPATPLPPAGGAPAPFIPTSLHPAPRALPPPSLDVERPKPAPGGGATGGATPPPPNFELPPLPSYPPPSGVVPIGGAGTPKLPATPAGGAVPPVGPPAGSPAGGAPLPVPPPTGGIPTLPPLPAVPPAGGGPVALPPLPGVSPTEPKLPPPSGLEPITPKPPDAPLTPKQPDSLFPPVTPGSTPVTPKSPEVILPPLPGIPPAGGTGGTPAAFPPLDPTPKNDVKPPPPAFDPPSGFGTPTGFSKPAGSPEVKPLVPELSPKTEFDVDLYDPRANDTYETISQEFYNDKRFSAALKAFNQNQPLQGGRLVNVPPIHILKRRFPAQTGGVAPTGIVPPAASPPDWGPAAGKLDPTPFRAAGNARNTLVIPQGGLSMRAVARLTLGNDQRWPEIYAINPQFRSDEVLPAGTELRMPADAKLP